MELSYVLTWPIIGLVTGLWLMVMLPHEERTGWIIVLIGCAILGPIIAIGVLYDEVKHLTHNKR
jgi:hypothetical protein